VRSNLDPSIFADESNRVPFRGRRPVGNEITFVGGKSGEPNLGYASAYVH
jgi:hypothetical protein